MWIPQRFWTHCMRDCSFYPLLMETFLFTALDNPASEYVHVVWLKKFGYHFRYHTFLWWLLMYFFNVGCHIFQCWLKMAILKKESPFPNDYLDIHVRFLGCILNTSCWSPKKRSPHPKDIKKVQITTNSDHLQWSNPTQKPPVFWFVVTEIFFVFFFRLRPICGWPSYYWNKTRKPRWRGRKRGGEGNKKLMVDSMSLFFSFHP